VQNVYEASEDIYRFVDRFDLRRMRFQAATRDQ